MNDKEKVAYGLVQTGLVVPMAFWSGYVLQKLWGWFIVPAFDVAAIHTWEAAGLIVLIAWLTHKNEQPEPQWSRLVEHALLPALVLGAAWLIHAIGT